DGIRDRNVTGVQTCALPISADARIHTRRAVRMRAMTNAVPRPMSAIAPPISAGAADPPVGASPPLGAPSTSSAADAELPVSAPRSEERRVGEECSWGGSAEQ